MSKNNKTCTIKTNPNFWDCECERDYIHTKHVNLCLNCGHTQEDMPDSRQDEIDKIKLNIRSVLPRVCAMCVNKVRKNKYPASPPVTMVCIFDESIIVSHYNYGHEETYVEWGQTCLKWSKKIK